MKIFLSFFMPFFLFPYAGGAVNELARVIPKQISGWRAAEKDMTYNRQTLYDYMDGGAEVYLAFDFQEVFVRKFSGPGSREMALDIYDMGSSAEAFGIFSCDREDEEAGLGQESEYGFGLLRFWQGKYFVTITAAAEDEATKKAILELGKAVAGLLGPPGTKPAMLDLLPEKNLRKNRLSYFHGNVNLNNRFFIASENILHLSRTTNCLFAEYDASAGEPGYLLIIQYPDPTQAQAASESFIKSYIPEAKQAGLAKTENNKWVMAVQKDNILSIVFEAPSEQWASELQSAIKFQKK